MPTGHQIGPHEFVLLRGEVPKIKSEREVIRYKGDDLHLLRNIGLRTEPFRLESLDYVASIVAGRTLLETYAALAGSPPQSLIKDAYDYSAAAAAEDQVKVAVLNVEQVELKKVAAIAGTADQFVLRCAWTLILSPSV